MIIYLDGTIKLCFEDKIKDINYDHQLINDLIKNVT